MKFRKKQSNGVQVLTLSEKLTIQNANKLKTVLVKSFDSTGSLRLNFEKVTEADLFCLQLLCSANMTAIKLKKHLEITGINSEIFKKAIGEAGYFRHTGCNLDCNKSCLWVDESKSK